jgi:hypothetical protein
MEPFDSEKQNADLSEAVKAAYPEMEPSTEGRRRVASLATQADSRREAPVRRTFWKPRRLGWALLFVASAAAAIQYLLHRPGEQAIRLMPAETFIAITLDTTPSPEQVPLFMRLEEAMKREGLAGKTDFAFLAEGLGTKESSGSSLIQDIKPYLGRGFGLALLKTGTNPKNVDSVQPVTYIPVTNMRAVEQSLAAHGQRVVQRGLTYYRLRFEWFATTDMVAMLLADYLIVAPSPDLLFRVQEVSKGLAPAMADLTEYQAARMALPEDANLMLFVSPTALSWVEQESRQVGVRPFANTRWMALSARLDEEGLRFDWRSPTESGQNPALQKLGQILPIAPDAYRQLPAGAYGALGFSQPGRYWNALTATLLEGPDRQAFAQDVSEAERLFGLSIERDILPACEGHWWLGVYPDTSLSEGVGIIAIADSANGADPVALFAKSRASLERTLAPANRHRLEAWSPLKQTTGQWSKRLGPGEDAGEGEKPSLHIEWDDSTKGKGKAEDLADTPHFRSFSHQGVLVWQLETPRTAKAARSGRIEPSNAKKAGLYVAEVGRNLIAASTLELLDKALATWNGQGAALMDDPAFVTMQRKLTPGTQIALMVNLRRILERLSSSMKDSLKQSPIATDDLLDLFGGDNAGLAISSRYDGSLVTGTFFLPLDYERALHLIGRVSGSDGKSLPNREPIHK